MLLLREISLDGAFDGRVHLALQRRSGALPTSATSWLNSGAIRSSLACAGVAANANIAFQSSASNLSGSCAAAEEFIFSTAAALIAPEPLSIASMTSLKSPPAYMASTTFVPVGVE